MAFDFILVVVVLSTPDPEAKADDARAYLCVMFGVGEDTTDPPLVKTGVGGRISVLLPSPLSL